jgi:hypothetical protein
VSGDDEQSEIDEDVETAGDVDEQYPTVPDDKLADSGWSLRDTQLEVRARVAGFVVRAHERRYEDNQLRERVRSAGGPDHLWRLFYATRLTFTPSLPPVVGPSMALPKVRDAAREEFAEQLREEGLIDIDEAGVDHIEVESGMEVELTRYEATLPVKTSGGERGVPMEGWIALWHDDAMLLAGGLHPTEPLADVLGIGGIEYDPEASRTELQSLLADVKQ